MPRCSAHSPSAKMFSRRGPQMIVDHDAAVDGNSRISRKRVVRPDAGGKYHGISLDPPSIGELDAFDFGRAVDARGIGVEQHVDALALDQRLQQISRRRIELALHQPVHQMQQRHRRAGFCQPIGRFEAEQSAADHDDGLLARGEREQQIDIAAVPEGMHAREIVARHVEPQRRRAGGEHQPRVLDTLVARDLQLIAADIDFRDAAAIFHGDAAVAPPAGWLQFDLMRGRLAGQHRRQQHAVIGQPRLVADHGDGVAAERRLDEFVDQARRRHSIADDDQRFAQRMLPYSAACGRP